MRPRIAPSSIPVDASRLQFERIYASGEKLDDALAQFLPEQLASPTIRRLRSTAFLTTDALRRLEDVCRTCVEESAPGTSRPRLLDAGCGRGLLGCHLASGIGATLVGVDFASAAIAAAPSGRAGAFVQADLRQLPFDQGTFDVAIAIDSLHLLDELARVLSELRRVLTSSGRLVATAYYLGSSFQPPRASEAWQQTIVDAGFSIQKWVDVTSEWRRVMRAKHEVRWTNRHAIIALLGEPGHAVCSVSRQMLDGDGEPGFIDRNSRWEFVATPE
jgi:SAM-dependent methyltransferase